MAASSASGRTHRPTASGWPRTTTTTISGSRRLRTGTQRKISENREGIGDMAWSPDGRWLAYAMTAANTFHQIELYVTESGRSSTTSPTRPGQQLRAGLGSQRRQFLYFLSDRNLRSRWAAPGDRGSRSPTSTGRSRCTRSRYRRASAHPSCRTTSCTRPPGAAARPDSAGGRYAIDRPRGLAGRLRKVPLPTGQLRLARGQRRRAVLDRLADRAPTRHRPRGGQDRQREARSRSRSWTASARPSCRSTARSSWSGRATRCT